jgi:hypothetical protein
MMARLYGPRAKGKYTGHPPQECSFRTEAV